MAHPGGVVQVTADATLPARQHTVCLFTYNPGEEDDYVLTVYSTARLKGATLHGRHGELAAVPAADRRK